MGIFAALFGPSDFVAGLLVWGLPHAASSRLARNQKSLAATLAFLDLTEHSRQVETLSRRGNVAGSAVRRRWPDLWWTSFRTRRPHFRPTHPRTPDPGIPAGTALVGSLPSATPRSSRLTHHPTVAAWHVETSVATRAQCGGTTADSTNDLISSAPSSPNLRVAALFGPWTSLLLLVWGLRRRRASPGTKNPSQLHST